MFKSRMLDAIKQSRYIPPIWLAILIAIGFVYGGGILSLSECCQLVSLSDSC